MTAGWGSIYKRGKPAGYRAGHFGIHSRGTRDPTGFGECPPPQLRPAAGLSGTCPHPVPPASLAEGLGSRWGGGGGVFPVPAAAHFGSSSPSLPRSLKAKRGEPACTMNLWLLAFLVSCFVDTWAPTVHAQGTILSHTYPPSLTFPLSPSILLCPPHFPVLSPPEAPSEPISTTEFSDSSPTPGLQKLLAPVQLLGTAGSPASLPEPP